MTRNPTPDQIFVDLVDTYLDRVYRYLCNLTQDPDNARDLCHEVFLNLRRQVDEGTEIVEAYVFATARNTALSRWRNDKREEIKREGWGRQRGREAPTSCLAEKSELRQALQAALAVLSEDQRSVFLLSEVEGLKYVQIAEALGISAGTVASRKFNAVRALRGELERLGHAMP